MRFVHTVTLDLTILAGNDFAILAGSKSNIIVAHTIGH